MGRPGSAEEIAAAVIFCASPASAYMTGQSFNVDGGVTSRYPLPLPKSDTSMAG
jgi:NAD(P)-dependent dehydrogenase (short-subunit alcohol dehydrogenase family)